MRNRLLASSTHQIVFSSARARNLASAVINDAPWCSAVAPIRRSAASPCWNSGPRESTAISAVIVSTLAEVERSLIQERTRESVEHRRRTGGNVGGRPALPDGRRELVKRLRAEGKSYREIAEICGVSLATAHHYGSRCDS